MFLCGCETRRNSTNWPLESHIIFMVWTAPGKRKTSVRTHGDVTRSRAPARRATRVSFTAGPAPHARAPVIPPPSCRLQAGAHGAPPHIIRSGTAHMFLIARRVCVLFAFIISYSSITIIYIGFFTHTNTYTLHTQIRNQRARTLHTYPSSLPSAFSSFFPSFFHWL